MTDGLKLFHVDITYSVMVAASDENAAERLAQEQLSTITPDEYPDIMCTGLVTKVSAPWKGSLPWGDNQEFTCEHFTGEA